MIHQYLIQTYLASQNTSTKVTMCHQHQFPTWVLREIDSYLYPSG